MNLIECIDHYFEETKSHMEGLLEVFEESYVTIDITSLYYYDILKKLKFNLCYECDW